jgi:hypothetical protein
MIARTIFPFVTWRLAGLGEPRGRLSLQNPKKVPPKQDLEIPGFVSKPRVFAIHFMRNAHFAGNWCGLAADNRIKLNANAFSTAFCSQVGAYLKTNPGGRWTDAIDALATKL